MRIIFAGSGGFGVPTLAALIAAGHEVFVFTQPDRPAGRGRKLTGTPVAVFCRERALHVTPTADLNAETLPSADLMVVIAFGQKIAPGAVNHPRLGSINLHASLLPKFRGAAPINWAILRGESETGNSVIRLAQRMDAGAILTQNRVQIGELETAGELHDRLAREGVRLVQQVVSELQIGATRETFQDESQATLAPKLSRNSALIDWTHSAADIARQIRGLSPWPGCRVQIVDAAGSEKARATLLRARATQGEGPRWHSGEITLHGCVAAGKDGEDQAVEVLDIQPDGKRAMSLEEYRRGNLWVPGLKLVSI